MSDMARRILALAPFPPRADGTHGGTRAIAQLLGRKAERNELGLLFFRAPGEDGIDPELVERCAFVEEIARPATGSGFSGAVSRLRLLGRCARGLPPWAAKFRVPRFAERVADVVSWWHPEIVEAEYHIMAQYFELASDRQYRRLLVSYEPGAATAQAAAMSARGVSRGIRSVEALIWKGFEHRALNKADGVVVLTSRDRTELEKLGSRTPITVIPLGTIIPPLPLNPAGIDPPRVLFVGNFMHPPNIAAARSLAENIFPAIKRRLPNAQLDIVGANAPGSIRDLAGPGVNVVGRVPEVTPYLDRAAVVAVPLRSGGGMRVKVIEALAAGKALVASPLAAEGLAADPPLLLAESDAEFVDAICSLLDSPSRRIELAGRGRRWAKKHLSWERSIGMHEQLYDQLLADAPPRLIP